MINNKDRGLHILTLIIITLGVIVSTTGLFYTTGGKAFDFTNIHGDTVKIYGDGLYAMDSHLLAPVFRGTDFTILFIVIPLLIAALIIDIKRRTLKGRLILMAFISVFTYYSASLAFGVTYNVLHLVYIALFSASLFGLIVSMCSLDKRQVTISVGAELPYGGIYIFLSLTGIALIAAWLPDIIDSLASGRALKVIEVYTTSVTNVLDMGIIGPAALICLFQLIRRRGMGYILLEMLLTVCMVVGIMLPMQTVFQISAGIELPLPVLLTKVASFVVLALFAVYFNIKFLKSIRG